MTPFRLTTGSRLANYEVLAPLGAGGMGEVYRARDTKLGRDVAIKVLPEHFAEDKDRMARFEREARVLASLNHPNIAAVYGLEESDGFHYLVMELVPGESLAAKIQKGPLPVADVLAIARQLIDALEAAHENGVIHRDLKPANVQITPDGQVKVLDFGLAKVESGEATSTETSLSPTMPRDATQAGIILGTAAYMSPEQARGLRVDKRSDIFSFGCVVFEMLTGRKTFEGELVSDVMAAVIKSEPNWSRLTRSASRLRKLLGRCLEKDPKKRLRDIGDARVDLEEAVRAPIDVGTDGSLISRRRAVVLASVSSLLVAVVIGLLVWRWAPASEVRGNVTRFRIEVTGRGGARAVSRRPYDRPYSGRWNPGAFLGLVGESGVAWSREPACASALLLSGRKVAGLHQSRRHRPLQSANRRRDAGPRERPSAILDRFELDGKRDHLAQRRWGYLGSRRDRRESSSVGFAA